MCSYTHLVLHSLGAAIPHSLLLLHAVLDTLPYPRGPRGLWYEIHTGTAECVDYIEAEDPARPIATLPKRNKKDKKQKEAMAEPEQGVIEEDVAMAESGPAIADTSADPNSVHAWLAGIGSVSAGAPARKVRLTVSSAWKGREAFADTQSTMKVDIWIGPKPSLEPTAPRTQTGQSKPGEGRSRPNKHRRRALQSQREAEAKAAAEKKALAEVDEEGMNNAAVEAEEEEQEAVEKR
jgi:hypothetical protein